MFIKDTMSRQEEFEIFDLSSRLRNFANIALLAYKGKQISEVDQAFLIKMASKIEVQEHQVEGVRNNLQAYPVPQGKSKEQRLELLFDLYKKIYGDVKLDKVEGLLKKNFVIGKELKLDPAEIINQRGYKLVLERFFVVDHKNFIKQA